MNKEKMKNIVVLKDLPSNIAKEAYVVLKPNIKINKKVENLSEQEKWPGYILKEAESVISSYLANIENNKNIRNMEIERIKKKYKHLRKFCIGMGIVVFLNILIYLVR